MRDRHQDGSRKPNCPLSPQSRRRRGRMLRAATRSALCGIEPLESRVLLAGTPFTGAPVNLPATIEAENFDNGGEGVAYHDTTAANLGGQYRNTGVDIEKSTDTSGGAYQVSYINAGEWLTYTVNAPTSGNYTFNFRLASLYSGSFHVEVDGVNQSGAINWSGTGGWDNFFTMSRGGIIMSAGVHTIKIAFDATGGGQPYFGKFNWFQVVAPPPPQLPTVSVAATDPNASEAGPDNGIFTFTRSGDTSKALTINYSVAGTATSGSDYNALPGSVTIAAGQTAASVAVTPIDDSIVEPDETVIAQLSNNAAYTVGSPSSATVVIHDNDSPSVPSTPFGGTPFTPPGTLEAENYDNGGEGVAYHDAEPANLGGQYRTAEGVDIETAKDTSGGYDVGYITPGEWLKYTVNAPTTGNYTFNFRVASGSGGTFHLEVDGVNKSGPITLPNTGGFQTWTDVTKSGINMTAGQHVLRLVFDSVAVSWTSYIGNLNYLQITPPGGAQPPPLPTVTIAATDPNASETGPDTGTFTVTRTGDTSAALAVPITLSGTATNGTDYASVPSSITVPAGQPSANIVITPIDDQLTEGDESVIATINPSAAFTIGNQSTATVTIADNDSPTQPGSPTPFSGTPISLPGLIEAENYDLGGEGVAYHDTTPSNEGKAYRLNEGVDVEPAADTGGGYDVGFTHAGEWLGYTVSVATAGNYDLDVRAANYGAGGAFHVEVDGQNVTGTLAVPNTGAFQTYTDITKTSIPLTAGQHFVKLVMDGNSAYGFSGNFNWMKWTATPTAPPPPPQGPFGGTPWGINANIEAENYDVGGEGVAYHDTTPANEGQAYRLSEGVDVEPTTDTGGGYDVGYTHAGEWLEYTINIPTAGKYDLAARVASGGPAGTFHVEFAGIDKTGAISIPNTGAWQAYTTVTKPGIDLAAGTYVMKVAIDSNGAYGFAGNFNWFKLTPSVGGNPGNGQQPDLQIRNYGDTAYSGVNIINTDGANQIRGNDSPFLPVIYQVRVVNTGSQPDHFLITGTPSDSPNWRVWYFDSQVQGNPQTGAPGGNNITDAVTGAGWDTGILQPGQFRDFRFEAGASPLLPASAQENISVTATSAGDPSKRDVIKAIAINDTRRELAIRRRNYAQADGESGTYLLDVQNYGNIADQYRITGPAGGPGFTVRYFDAYSGGQDITAAVTGSGYVTNAIGFHAVQDLAVQIIPTDGQVHSATLTVRSVADSNVADTATISNSRPADPPSFFPIGVFGMPTWAFDTWKARGANTVVGYDSFGGQDSVDIWSQAAVDRGLYMIRAPRANPADDLNQKNLLAWMQPDEEDLPWNNYPPSTAQQVYNNWKQIAPNIPVWSNWDGSDVVGWQRDVPLSNYSGYLNATDWGSSGVYPISGWNRPDDLDVSGRAMDWLEKTGQGKPEFAVIESSNQQGPWLPPNSPSPTPTQVRAQVWDSIIHGARGIVYFPQAFTPNFIYDNTALDVAAEITKQNALITSIGAALESPIDPPSAGMSYGAPLEATWRVYNGHTYFIVLNLSGQTLTNQVMGLKGTTGTTATVQGENRSVAVTNNSITDSFNPYEVHVYVV